LKRPKQNFPSAGKNRGEGRREEGKARLGLGRRKERGGTKKEGGEKKEEGEGRAHFC
jgi:hypothetical protein